MRPDSSKNREEGGTSRRSRGRPRNFDAEGVADAAVEVFWRRGFQGASMDDLVAATGASRASLYKLHGDKGALMVAAVARYSERFDARVEALRARGLPARDAVGEALAASADRLCDPAAPPGCLRCRATQDRGADPRVDAAVEQANADYVAGMERLLRAGRPEADVRGVALFLAAVVDGMVTLAEGGASRAELQAVIDLALGVLLAET